MRSEGSMKTRKKHKPLPDFGCRSTESELMDGPGISFEEFHDCLQELELINHLTLAYRPTLAWLRPWLKSGDSLSILDAGSGGGDMLRQIARRVPEAGKRGTRHELVGVDLNPWSKKAAQLSDTYSFIRYETDDIFEFESHRSIDIIICSLFTHHLTDTQVVTFLRWLDERAEKGWFINDLHRHPLPYYFIKATTALFSRNRLIRNDAAVSVARSFSVADWRRLLERAGMSEKVTIKWFFPFRLCLFCNKAATIYRS